jgi:hypothetical protein
MSADDTIHGALQYARSFLGIPYKWHRADDPIAPNDKFWASSEPLTITAEAIQQAGKSIVCTGLVNLVRRHLGLTVPGLDTPFSESHACDSEKGYYTHICRPEHWILRD